MSDNKKKEQNMDKNLREVLERYRKDEYPDEGGKTHDEYYMSHQKFNDMKTLAQAFVAQQGTRTTKLPEVAGWYFWRQHANDPWQPVRVCADLFFGFLYAKTEDGHNSPLDGRWAGVWQGPIKPVG
jgi:hypothetical protein